eukprot:14907818-Ditylum_brightwellii.AAC.1
MDALPNDANSKIKSQNKQPQQSDTKLVMDILISTLSSLQNDKRRKQQQQQQLEGGKEIDKQKDERNNNYSLLKKDDNDDNEEEEEEHLALAQAMSQIHGEYSFIFFCGSCDSSSDDNAVEKSNYDKNSNCHDNSSNNDYDDKHAKTKTTSKNYIYFGRDPIGRRSLLMVKPTIASTTTANDVDGDGVVKKEMNENHVDDEAIPNIN